MTSKLYVFLSLINKLDARVHLIYIILHLFTLAKYRW
jgi:hypothetical protein